MKRFDTPQQVSVHLVAAMGCCTPTPPSNSYFDRVLGNQKLTFQKQMRLLQQKCLMLPSASHLTEQIAYLENVIMKFQMENNEARRVGFKNVQSIATEFIKIEHIEADKAVAGHAIEREYLLELEAHRELTREIEEMIMKIRLLHQSNNLIVRNFGS